MAKEDARRSQGGSHDGTGARGGKEALSPEQQEAPGFDADSEVDEALRQQKKRQPGGLNPNTIVRN